MLRQLDSLNEYNITLLKKSKMLDLMSNRYTNPRNDIKNHIDSMGSTVEQLAVMSASMDEMLTACNLIASIEVPEMRSFVEIVSINSKCTL